MYDLGVLDSYRNIRYYLEDSCSIGGYLMSIECIVANTKYYNTTPLDKYPKQIF